MGLTDVQYELARLYGVQTSYHDIGGVERVASPDGLLAILRALGAPIERWEQGGDTLHARRQFLAGRVLEPVVSWWEGELPSAVVRFPAGELGQSFQAGLLLEDGSTHTWSFTPSELPDADVDRFGIDSFVPKRLVFPVFIAPGYHRLTVEGASGAFNSYLISAPAAALSPAEAGLHRSWGGFLPLHALRTDEGLGIGDYPMLGRLAEWLGGKGASTLATLPLLPTFLAKPYDPSPYAPVSRLFWNEFFIDVTKVPEFAACGEVKTQTEMLKQMEVFSSLRNDDHVRYKEAYAVKRMLLSKLAQQFFQNPSSRWNEFATFTKSRPDVEDYARFRAATELHRKPWSEWPQAQKSGRLSEADFKVEARDFYVYTQWIAHEQLKAATAQAEAAGVGLYLDLPVGVHPDGYDVWREQSSYANGVTTGAPPDPFFSAGQNWGFAPLQPEAIRDRQYGHFIGVIRHHLLNARILRIDHVMGLHRLYWIPRGAPATEGVYVHYRAEELFGIVALESHRNRAVIVGEDLGTVPDYVRETMAKRNFQRLYVMQFMCTENPDQAVLPVPDNAVASFNTHDMPPFASFWTGDEFDRRQKLGFLSDSAVAHEKEMRGRMRGAVTEYLRRQGLLPEGESGLEQVMRALSVWLAKGPAWLTQVSLEDLWLETEPQNVPGTHLENPNWTRKAKKRLEEFMADPSVNELLSVWNAERKK